MKRSTRYRTNLMVLKAVRLSLKYRYKTLKQIAGEININYKTLHSAWCRRGITLRDIRKNGFDGNYSVKY